MTCDKCQNEIKNVNNSHTVDLDRGNERYDYESYLLCDNCFDTFVKEFRAQSNPEEK
jgi:hypothetical protein